MQKKGIGLYFFHVQGARVEESSILAESRSVLEAVQLPGTRAHLVYASPRSRGYLSTIQLQLTPDEKPLAVGTSDTPAGTHPPPSVATRFESDCDGARAGAGAIPPDRSTSRSPLRATSSRRSSRRIPT